MTELTIEQFSKSHGEPAWLMAKRQVASEIYQSLPLNAQQRPYQIPNPKLNATNVNYDNLASTSLKASGVIMMDLLAAAQQYPTFIQENLMEKAIPWRENALNARHLAYLNSGAFIFIPSNVVCEEPVNLSTLINHQQVEKHLLIIVGANAEVTFTFNDKTSSNTKDCLMVEVLLGDNAHVKYFDDSNANSDYHHRVLNAYLARNASLKIFVGIFNSNNTLYDSSFNLDGEQSEGYLNVISLGVDSQQQTINAEIVNNGRNTHGEIQERGIVANQAKTNFHTNGVISKTGYGAYSDQASRLLTLDSTSQGQVDPVLLIDNYDVVAGHAASVGKVNADQLYYLNSRGIPLRQAKLLLTRGFLLPLIDSFPNKQMRHQMLAKLEARFNVK
ncbi:FeS assembly protein SufD [Apilactobacillus ozensis DSM 23829 = JCM 17196]|uniref:FeS assembly protein SufD n=1 Tax=Apilactobacillus ozensis DSM 23829 = JCM 17196 TaxID=1423781 RepID=A0A0R2AKU6_9LACO|nr:SufD family Fe-S cluster assembly protein [Apilactobacillus ozensis]KRM67527.1 FeS assembly protein SufD [Apilactobacillus ozensis DSM 23829 = JCM 17196]